MGLKDLKVIFYIVAGVLSLAALMMIIIIAVEFCQGQANQAATRKQTYNLKTYIENSIDDVRIIDVYSETGNTSGTGNHVDCLSMITFVSEKSENDLRQLFEKQYPDSLLKGKNDCYEITVVTEAPFPDQFDGH